MAKTFNELANDLKEFIIDKHSNYGGMKHLAVQRYNNLKVSMNPTRFHTPHVVVQIGMSEGVYNLPDCTKSNGGLGMDERYVIQWLGNDMVRADLDSHWRAFKDE